MTNSHVNANFSKRLRIFKNGDDSFGGKQIVISQRATKSWDAFLAQVTNQLDSNVAVRSIHTPVNGTAITSMDQLSDKLDYVAVTTGTFRKLNYTDFREKKPLTFHKPKALTLAEELEIAKNKMNVPGRIKDVQTGSMSIFVYANGDTAGPAQRVTMPWKGLDRLEALINEVDIRMKSRNLDARSLYTLDGHMITNINQLEPGGYYVAVGVGVKGFVKGDYGSVVKPHFYVPLNRNATRNASWQSQPTEKYKKQSKGSIFYNSKNGTSENSVSGGSGSSSVRISPGSKKASSPQSDVTIKTSRSNKPQKPMYKSEGNLSFKQKSKQQQQQQQQQQKQKQQRIVTKEVDYDNDEGGIFKAKQQRRETKHAQVIREDHQTKVEMPVELMNADDVMEDIEYNKEHQSTGHRKGRPSNMEHEERSGHETRNDPHNALLASHAEELDDIEKNNTYRIEDHDVEMANEDYENNVE